MVVGPKKSTQIKKYYWLGSYLFIRMHCCLSVLWYREQEFLGAILGSVTDKQSICQWKTSADFKNPELAIYNQ